MIDKRSRYKNGVTTIRHKGVVVTTSLNSQNYEDFSSSLPSKAGEVGYIPAGFEHRPDLISDAFYSDPSKWWLIMEANNIDDPFESLETRDRIIVPII